MPLFCLSRMVGKASRIRCLALRHRRCLISIERQISGVRRDMWSIQASAPIGEIVFYVDGKNMSWCPSGNSKEEILDFALSLSQIIHTLVEGQALTQFRMMEGGTRYFTFVDKNLLKIETDFDEDTAGLCRFPDFKEHVELFCVQMHDEIVRLFPSYFELMDKVSGNKVFDTGKTARETAINLLLWPKK